MRREKRIPKLEKLQVNVDKPKRRKQDWKEQFAIMGQWIAVTDKLQRLEDKRDG